MFCSKCGEKINRDSRFCRFCGEHLEVTSESSPIQPTKKWFLPPFVLLMGIVITSAYFYLLNQEKEQVIYRETEALIETQGEEISFGDSASELPVFEKPVSDLFQDDSPAAVIVKVIEKLKNQEIARVYEEDTSVQLKEVSDKNDFDGFVKEFSALQNFESYQMQEPAFDEENTGYLVTDFRRGNEVSQALFVLVQEDNAWKILGIQELVKDSSDDSPNQASAFRLANMELGSEINEEGILVQPDQVFQSDLPTLFVNVYVENVQPEETIQLVMKQKDLDIETQPVFLSFEKNGNHVKTFYFLPPEEGWPAGNYEMVVISSSKASLEIPFRVIPIG